MTDSLISGSSLSAHVTAPRDPLTLAGPPVARTLLDVFAATVARCEGRTAIDAPGSTLTYLELEDAARSLADRLRSCGVGPGDRVGVRVPSGTAELYIAILGVLSAGAAYVPVDADDPDARAAAIFDDAAVSAVVGAELQIAHLREARGADRQPLPDDDAWVIFTSGSTGRPKGVAVTHRAAAAFVDAETGLWTVNPEDRVLAGLSVGFDASCEELWLAWRNGATLVPAPRERVRAGPELGPWLAERRVTVVSTVPTLAAMWDEADLAAVRLLILGGEACPEPLAWRLAAGRELWNTYGPTEATVVSTATRVVPGAPVTIGWPLRGWEVAILDEVGEPVPVGELGELVIAGVGLGRYLDPTLDAERYAAVPALGWDRAYRTGDIVCETIDGLRFLGRRDDQVKLGGRRIELGEVEAVLAGLPGVRAAAAALQKTEAGNPVLVGYVVGELDPAEVSRAVSETLPQGVVPVVLAVDSLPLTSSGKVDRKALPWPPAADAGELTGTPAWLAERWAEQLGPLPIGIDSDFFELGGSSLAAAKLTSVLRTRYPAVAIADVYEYRTLATLAERLESMRRSGEHQQDAARKGSTRFAAAQLLSVMIMLALRAPQWVVGVLFVDRLWGASLGPQVGWAWIAGGYVLFGSALGRALLALVARRLLLAGVRPGRYSRRGWVAWRVHLLQEISGGFRINSLAGTPFAARYARLSGHRVGRGVRLQTLPPATSLIRIGDGAVIEKGVDLHGWSIVGSELVIGAIDVGSRARVGARAHLLGGARIGAHAEIEAGSVVTGSVPAGEYWSGVPARPVGQAGERWPASAPPQERHPGLWKSMYALALALEGVLLLVPALPGLAVILLLMGGHIHGDSWLGVSLASVVGLVLLYMLCFALIVGGVFRYVSRLLRPGWYSDAGAVAWALWFTGGLMEEALGLMFPVYMSLYTRTWLRLLGLRVGKRTEMSHAITLNRLTTLGAKSFATDDVSFTADRSRGGWLCLEPIAIGDGSFLGNSSLVNGGTQVGNDSLVGVLTSAPREIPDDTTWFGYPALQLPRVPDCADPARTIDPPARLILARGAVELFRILGPTSITAVLGLLMFAALNHLAAVYGPPLALALTPALELLAGVSAVLITVLAKWLIMGRYRAGQHPLWSLFVWRDEIMNSMQEVVARPWLLGAALGTPILPWYLRAMGARVGRDVWCETLNLTEFDVVELGNGCAINRAVHVETHLFHDRMLRIGPTLIGAGATLGPQCAVLPDTIVGAGCYVGDRSVVMRGEELPPGTSWHGAPVRSV